MAYKRQRQQEQEDIINKLSSVIENKIDNKLHSIQQNLIKEMSESLQSHMKKTWLEATENFYNDHQSLNDLSQFDKQSRSGGVPSYYKPRSRSGSQNFSQKPDINSDEDNHSDSSYNENVVERLEKIPTPTMSPTITRKQEQHFNNEEH